MVFRRMLFSFYPLLILLAPLAAGVIVGLKGTAIGPKASRLGVTAELIAFVLALVLLIEVSSGGPKTLQLSPWSGGILQFALYLDRLSAVMLVHIAAISILIHLFSIRYMQQERGYACFHSLLAFTTFVLFGMVSSANLLMLLLFWQLLSWLLPLLSHNYQHPPTVRGAFRTFIMQRFGDAAFLAAVVLAYGWYGTLDLQQLFARAAEVKATLSLWPGLDMNAATAVTLLIFIGAMAKSAQFPLHMWLPDALYAPTPVHRPFARRHHQCRRFSPGPSGAALRPEPGDPSSGVRRRLAHRPARLLHDAGPKRHQKTLGYSTIGQMGFMIMECGVGAYGLAIFHLIAHGLFKGSIFLNCGYVIHAARKEPRVPPKHEPVESAQFSALTWLTGFATTLILPLIIVLAAHGILDIPLRDSQGTAIFLFFGWATSSQAILTLYRLRAVESWKVAVAMLSVLFVVVVTYLLAAESFTHFLFPAPGEVASTFKAGALAGGGVRSSGGGLCAGHHLRLVSDLCEEPRPHDSHAERGRRAAGPALSPLAQPPLSRRFLREAPGALVTRGLERLNASQSFPFVAASIAVVAALYFAAPLPELPAAEMAITVFAALLLPLFPLHGVRRRADARAGIPWRGSRRADAGGGIVRPGQPLTAYSRPGSPGHQRARPVRRALWIAQSSGANESAAVVGLRKPRLFSALWWHATVTGTVTAQAVVYSAAVALLIAALLFAWQRVGNAMGISRWNGCTDWRSRCRALPPWCRCWSWPASVCLPSAFFPPTPPCCSSPPFDFRGTHGHHALLVFDVVVSVQNDAAAALRAPSRRYSL
jgi:NADH-quinone oxidoreductase subunit L